MKRIIKLTALTLAMLMVAISVFACTGTPAGQNTPQPSDNPINVTLSGDSVSADKKSGLSISGTTSLSTLPARTSSPVSLTTVILSSIHLKRATFSSFLQAQISHALTMLLSTASRSRTFIFILKRIPQTRLQTAVATFSPKAQMSPMQLSSLTMTSSLWVKALLSLMQILVFNRLVM